MMENKMTPNVYTEKAYLFDKEYIRSLQDCINHALEKQMASFNYPKEKEVVKLKLYD